MLEPRDGKPHAIRVAVVDSGVTIGHPHVGAIAEGVSIGLYQNSAGFTDVLGHGTAVCGAIRMHCTDCQLVAVRVFERALAAPAKVVLRAIDWCLSEARASIINLSLGTGREDLRDEFAARVAAAAQAGVAIVSPWETLPGSISGVIGVDSDRSVPFGRFRVERRDGRRVILATPYARPVPGVPVEYNYRGASFASAHVAGLLAARWAKEPSLDLPRLVDRFVAEGEAEAIGEDRP